MTNFLSLICPNCGGAIEIKPGSSKIRCPYCQGEHIFAGIDFQSEINCPVCKKDDKLEKVSAIIARESADTPLTRILTLSEPDYNPVHKPQPPFPLRTANPIALARNQEELAAYKTSFALYEKQNAVNEHRRSQQNQRLEIWNDLYYCHRDGCVCLPRLGLHADIKELESFVNTQWWRRYGQQGETSPD